MEVYLASLLPPRASDLPLNWRGWRAIKANWCHLDWKIWFRSGPNFIELLKQNILLESILLLAGMGRIPVTSCTCDTAVWLVTFSGKAQSISAHWNCSMIAREQSINGWLLSNDSLACVYVWSKVVVNDVMCNPSIGQTSYGPFQKPWLWALACDWNPVGKAHVF